MRRNRLAMAAGGCTVLGGDGEWCTGQGMMQVRDVREGTVGRRTRGGSRFPVVRAGDVA